VARGEAQSAADRLPWDPDAQKADIAQQQKTSDRLSSPNHRLNVTKAHPTTWGITKAPALPTDAP
jgi:hypothetical protein